MTEEDSNPAADSRADDKLIETWLMAMDGPIDDHRRAEFNRCLAEHSHLRERLIQLVQEQSWLMWHGSEDLQVGSNASLSLPITLTPEPEEPFQESLPPQNQPGLRTFGGYFFGLAIGFCVGALVAAFFVRNLFLETASGPITRRPLTAPLADQSGENAEYAATLVNVTNCRWEPHSGLADVEDNRVLPGQTLRLAEGIAELSSARLQGGSGRFVLEGPLAMVMTGGGTPTLQHGKLFAAVDPKHDEFLLGTPLGQVTIDGSTSMGVIASGGDVAIHVFAGSATFELLWSAESLDEDQFRITAGTSLRLIVGKNRTLQVHRGNANERSFIATVPMAEDRLVIGNEYVAAVRQAQPLAYWRFEADTAQSVRNEVGDRFHIRIHGEMGWRDYPGNRAADLGVAGKPGYFLTDDDFGDMLTKAYSLEAWVKPSHIHLGAILGFLDWSTETPLTGRHGILLELCGPAGPWSNRLPTDSDPPRSPSNPIFHPERLRLLQRVPPSADGNLGTSCYSKAAYECRKWQHYAGVKDGKSLRLYINGELVAEQSDDNDAPAGLRALVGQVWPSGIVGKKPSRQFVGEIDEMAVYGRALEPSELIKHYRLGHEAPSTSGATY